MVRARALLDGRWGMLHAALARGFVIESERWLLVWDALRDRPVRLTTDAQFVAARRWRFAFCRGLCRTVRVWRRTGPRSLALPPGARWLGSGGAFSPDERLLALPIVTAGRARLAVANLRTRRWTLVPGPLGGYQTAAWSPSGRWLYFTSGERGLRAWQPGAATSVPLPIAPGGTVMSIATAR
jgi:hypothetical protein